MDLADRAREFAADAYDSDKELEHPLDVARIVACAGGGEEAVAAAILHDLLEDTDVSAQEIAAEFGSRVAAYVSALTEDESLDEYLERKDEHRRRACAAGRDVAMIFVADKLSNARRMRRKAKRPELRKIGHYAATRKLMGDTYPGLPLLPELDDELVALRADLQRAPA